jgi:hypothetical protein
MFTQENEPIAFPNIHSILNDKSLSENIQNRVIKIRKAYFNYLNSHSDYTVELFEGHPTRMDILKTVMYGGMVHINNQKTIEMFQEWTRDSIRESLLLQEFSSILNQLLVLIKVISEVFENELNLNI